MMASPKAAMSLVRRQTEELARMPPPPFKRIKRPPKVLDEDEYTAALSDIIARDYFPGLRESEAQNEYIDALEANDEAWIAEAAQKLRATMAPFPEGQARRTSRNTRFDSRTTTPLHTLATDTPKGFTGGETPRSEADTFARTVESKTSAIDTSTLSLSAFQAKYTSEDNESFNSVLDKQNQKRREKNAYLWTQDQRIPSARQIEYRATQARLLEEKEESEAQGKALIPIKSGATESRPAKPDAWTIKNPANGFMFNPDSIDEAGLQTVQELQETNSRAEPKRVVHANTRFPVLQFVDDPGPIPPSPSLNTEIIAQRDEARAAESEMGYSGSETPRVNGYAFVDEDEPENVVPEQSSSNQPSYRDLLAGQVGDSVPNPFKIGQIRKREDLHHRLVEREAQKKRLKEKETIRETASRTPGFTPQSSTDRGSMTPAARKLMEKLGRTPVAGHQDKTERMSSKDMWTPGRTPRRTHKVRTDK